MLISFPLSDLLRKSYLGFQVSSYVIAKLNTQHNLNLPIPLTIASKLHQRYNNTTTVATMVRNNRGPEPLLSPTQLNDGYRVVDGRVRHLDDMYRNKYEKLREFIKSIPCTQSSEQIEVLLSGKYTLIDASMQVSIHMSRVALKEYEKLRKKKLISKVKDIFVEHKAKELDRESMHEEYYEHEQVMRDMPQLWQKSFEAATRINSRKVHVGITEDRFDRLLKQFAEEEMRSTVDSFLPRPM